MTFSVTAEEWGETTVKLSDIAAVTVGRAVLHPAGGADAHLTLGERWPSMWSTTSASVSLGNRRRSRTATWCAGGIHHPGDQRRK